MYQVWLKKRSAWTVLYIVTLRPKLQIKLTISLSPSIRTLGQPIQALTLSCQVSRVATIVRLLVSLAWILLDWRGMPPISNTRWTHPHLAIEIFFFFYVWCDDHAIPSCPWPPGSLLSTVNLQLAPRDSEVKLYVWQDCLHTLLHTWTCRHFLTHTNVHLLASVGKIITLADLFE